MGGARYEGGGVGDECHVEGVARYEGGGVKPGLDDQLCQLSPCRQSTADIIGEVFIR